MKFSALKKKKIIYYHIFAFVFIYIYIFIYILIYHHLYSYNSFKMNTPTALGVFLVYSPLLNYALLIIFYSSYLTHHILPSYSIQLCLRHTVIYSLWCESGWLQCSSSRWVFGGARVTAPSHRWGYPYYDWLHLDIYDFHAYKQRINTPKKHGTQTNEPSNQHISI